MIYLLFLIAFLGLWAVLDFLMRRSKIDFDRFYLNLFKKVFPEIAGADNKPTKTPAVADNPKSVMSSGLEINELIKEYPSGKEKIIAVDIPKLKIKKGEFLAIMGRSGSGKSTLLNLIGALDKPTSGLVSIDGENIGQLKDKELSRLRNQKVGFVFQEDNLIPSLTAIENVELPLRYSKISKENRLSRAQKALEDVGLKDRVSHFPGELSGGQKQRVTIARALVTEPSIILADEPTGEVDSQTSEQIVSLMKELNRKRGTTFLIVTHDPAVAQATNRIIKLQDGKVISDKNIIKIDGANKAEIDLV